MGCKYGYENIVVVVVFKIVFYYLIKLNCGDICDFRWICKYFIIFFYVYCVFFNVNFRNVREIF